MVQGYQLTQSSTAPSISQGVARGASVRQREDTVWFFMPGEEARIGGHEAISSDMAVTCKITGAVGAPMQHGLGLTLGVVAGGCDWLRRLM